MKKLFLTLVIVFSPLALPQAVEGPMLTLETVKAMFEEIKANTNWDTDGDLLWGYFFTDYDPRKFTPLIKHLEQAGYKYVDVWEPEPEAADGVYFLHVERVEHHTPWSLHLRNQEFYRLAEKYGVESYDGMDVGEVEE